MVEQQKTIEFSVDRAAFAEPGIASELFQASLDLVQELLSSATDEDLTNNQRKAFRRIQQSLYLWGENHGVATGAVDSTLRRSRHLMRVVVTILRSLVGHILSGVSMCKNSLFQDQKNKISHLLEQAQFFVQDENNSEGGYSDCDETDSADGAPETLDDCLGDLSKDVQLINDLNASLTSPVLDLAFDSEASTAPAIKDFQPHLFFTKCIRERFPEASEDIVNHLGLLNLDRFQYLQHMRSKAHEQPGEVDIAVLDTISRPRSSTFHDSGFDSSGTSIAESTIYSHMLTPNTKGRSYPLLPEQAKSGSPFECAACGHQIVAKRTQEYRKHILQDLEPYTCLYDTCSIPLTQLSNRKSWIDHFILDHSSARFWKSYSCPLCSEVFPEEKYGLLTHISKHLEEISLLAIPLDIEVDEGPNHDEMEIEDTISVSGTDVTEVEGEVLGGSTKKGRHQRPKKQSGSSSNPTGPKHTGLPQGEADPNQGYGSIPFSQLGLTTGETQLLSYHQSIAAGTSSREAKDSSLRGRLLLDSSSLKVLGDHFDRLIYQTQQRWSALYKQTLAASETQYDKGGNLIEKADAEIALYKEILRQIDELQVEYDKIQRIGAIVKTFRGKLENLDRRL